MCFNHLHIDNSTFRESVSNSGPGGTDCQNQSEAQSQEARPQQVTQSCEVRDGEVVWVQSPSPQPPHHQAGHVEQNHHLDNNKFQINVT